MKKTFTTSLRIVLFGIFLSTGCVNETFDFPEGGGFSDGFPIRLSTDDYNDENTYYLLNDDESADIFFDPQQRSFYVDQPLQLSIDDDYYFQLRFYSPRALPDVTIWAKMEGYEEEFQLLKLEKILPFQQLRIQLPFATQDMLARTRSGKKIRIMANPHLDSNTLSFSIECDAPYYKTLQSIKSHCHIRFQDFCKVSTATYGKYPLRVYQAREGVAIALNMFYMFSCPEFESALKAWGPLYSDNNQTLVDKDALIKKALGHGELKFGNIGNGVLGLGGGGIFCLSAELFLEHYADDNSYTETIFHEYAHCIGYSHSGNMTYGGTTGWTALCDKMYVELAVSKKLPIYSRRFMNTRRNAKNQYNRASNYYKASKHIIEDPELDEIDGGLAPNNSYFLETDFGEEKDAPALSFKLDYTVAEVDQKNYMPRSVSVYGNKMYVTNDIRKANWTWDVYDLSSGKPVLEKRLTQWKNPSNGTTISIGQPDDILRSRDKIYLAGSNNCLFVFDAATYECTAMLGLGYNAVGMAATNGILYAYRGYVKAFPEHDLDHGAIATSSDLEAHSNNTMTADYSGNVYAVSYSKKQLIRVDSKYLMASKLTADEDILTFDANPLGAAWSSDGRLFVSFDKTAQSGSRFCEVDPKTGEILKDYTSIGDITLKNPAKCLIRRNTLFVIDRVNGLCIYAIPMSELK